MYAQRQGSPGPAAVATKHLHTRARTQARIKLVLPHSSQQIEMLMDEILTSFQVQILEAMGELDLGKLAIRGLTAGALVCVAVFASGVLLESFE